MSTRLVSVTLLSAALLSSCAPLHPDIRPEVAQPLDEARLLANGWSNRAVVMAKLNQAASVPNLNRNEQDKIRAVTIYALARNGFGGIPGAESGAAPARDTPQSQSMQYFHTDSRFAPVTTLGQTVSLPEWETAAERLEGRVIHENARSLIIGGYHRIADRPIRDG